VSTLTKIIQKVWEFFSTFLTVLTKSVGRRTEYEVTRDSAVADRPRDALC